MIIPLTAEELLQALGRGEDVPMGVLADAFRDAGMDYYADEVVRWRIIHREQWSKDHHGWPYKDLAHFWTQRRSSIADGGWGGGDSEGETIEGVRIDMAKEIRQALTRIFFSCHVCGAECGTAPDPPAQAVCEEHCPDHEYKHDKWERDWFCVHCNKQREYSYHDYD